MKKVKAFLQKQQYLQKRHNRFFSTLARVSNHAGAVWPRLHQERQLILSKCTWSKVISKEAVVLLFTAASAISECIRRGGWSPGSKDSCNFLQDHHLSSQCGKCPFLINLRTGILLGFLREVRKKRSWHFWPQSLRPPTHPGQLV